MRSDLIDIDMMIHVEGKKFIIASDTGDKKDAVWLPRSQIEISPSAIKGLVTITIPEWLATARKLM
jgi:hypothetical protein